MWRNLTSPYTRFCSYDGVTLCINYETGWRAALQKEIWWASGVSVGVSSQEGKYHPGVHQIWQTGQKRWLSLFSITTVLPWVLCAVLGPTVSERCEGPWMCPKEYNKLVRECEGIFYQEWMKMQGLSILDKRRLMSDLWHFSGSWGGEVERKLLIVSLWYPVTGHVGITQRCSRGGLDRI